eukprot:gene44827-37861_t
MLEGELAALGDPELARSARAAAAAAERVRRSWAWAVGMVDSRAFRTKGAGAAAGGAAAATDGSRLLPVIDLRGGGCALRGPATAGEEVFHDYHGGAGKGATFYMLQYGFAPDGAWHDVSPPAPPNSEARASPMSRRLRVDGELSDRHMDTFRLAIKAMFVPVYAAVGVACVCAAFIQPAYNQLDAVGIVGGAVVLLFGGLLPSLTCSLPPRRVAEGVIAAIVPPILLIDWRTAAVRPLGAPSAPDGAPSAPPRRPLGAPSAPPRRPLGAPLAPGGV